MRLHTVHARVLQALAIAALVVPAVAFGEDEDAPGRGVARISVLNGEVSLKRGDSGDITAAAINAPIMAQDQMQTGSGSRAEIQFDSANILRLGQLTEIHIADLENHRYTVQIGRGTATYRIQRDGSSDVEIGTPNVSVRPLRRGSYRISVLEDGTTEITVRSGEADINSQRGSQRLRAGQTMLARGSQTEPEFQIVAARAPDDWDHWNDSRDNLLANSRSAQYMSSDINGGEDLDAGGRWVSSPEYGNVWTPTVAPGWAPYRYGRWSWEDYYGWTWVSSDPWGWAPYHYGRWFNSPSYGWCWWPGGNRERHFWRPALVGFVGFGGGFGVGFGGIGWVPLGPYESFHPWYGRGNYGGYRNGLYNHGSVINNVNISNVYRNARVQNGITNVRSADFGRGSVNHVNVDAASYRSASMVRGPLPVAPDRSSLRHSDAQTRTQSQAVGSRNNSFYSRRTPTSVDRVPFEQQRSAISRASGGSANGGNSGLAGSAARSSDAAGGWRRFGDPTSRQAGSSAAGNAGRPASGSSNSSGWDRFGNPGSSNPGAYRNSSPTPARGYSQGVDRSSSRQTAPSRYDNGASPAPRMESQRVSPPPVVRQRSAPAPSYGGGSYGGGGGGGRMSAPAPSYGGGGGGGRVSAPAPSYGEGGGGGRVSATSPSSGGHSSSGGGGRSSSGPSSSGGSHSSSGGSHSSSGRR